MARHEISYSVPTFNTAKYVTGSIFSILRKKPLISRIFAVSIAISVVMPNVYIAGVSSVSADDSTADSTATNSVADEITTDATIADDKTVVENLTTDSNLADVSDNPVLINPNRSSGGNNPKKTNKPNKELRVTNEKEGTNASPAGGPDSVGSIRICKMIADSTGIIATSSANLPAASFFVGLKDGDTGNHIATTTVYTRYFAPNAKIILDGANDAQCVTFGNLPLNLTGYRYSEEIITEAAQNYWQTPKYNDQFTIPIENLDDFFLYDTTNPNADGTIVLTPSQLNRTLVVLNRYNPVVLPCAGPILTGDEFYNARAGGQIVNSIDAVSASSTTATFRITNTTGCLAPISFASYKMFDNVLYNQQLFDHSEVIYATSSTSVEIDLPPDCMAQIDAWYGLYPTTFVNTRTYIYPETPFVIAVAFHLNYGPNVKGAVGPFCTRATNTPPVLTLNGDNPMSVVVGNVFTDPGATAFDIEDGNISSLIVATGTVNTNIIGSYLRTYEITDTGGLSNKKTRTVNVTAGSNGGGGGGGSGGGGGGGNRRSSRDQDLIPSRITGRTVQTACPYINDYLNQEWRNDSAEVIKLQYFLNYIEGFKEVGLTGVFDKTTLNAVSKFQLRYFNDILKPWGYTNSDTDIPTGFVYILTKKKINEIYCQSVIEISDSERQEIKNRQTQRDESGEIGIKKGSSFEDIANSSLIGLNAEDDSKIIKDKTSNKIVLDDTGFASSSPFIGQNTEQNDINDGKGGQNIKAIAAAIFSIPNGREMWLQNLYFLLIALIAIYLVMEIIVGNMNTKSLPARRIWTRKIYGYIVGLAVAIIVALWTQIFSIVVPLIACLVALATFLVWPASAKPNRAVIITPPPKS